MITILTLANTAFIGLLGFQASRELGSASLDWHRADGVDREQARHKKLLLFGEGLLCNRSCRVEGAICRIGSSTENEFIIDSPTLPGSLLLICRRRGDWMLSRLNHEFPLFVNGRPLNGEACVVADDDLLELGEEGRFGLRVRIA